MSTYFVAGASRGIGIELVRKILENYPGSKVVAGARNPNENKDLKELQHSYKDRLTLVRLDITSDASVQASAEVIAKALPDGLDYLINCAGIMDSQAADSTPTELQNTYNTNVVGPFRVFRAALSSIRKGQRKVVVNVSSIAGGFTVQGLFHEHAKAFGYETYGYRASKAALNLLTVGLAKEYAAEGIIFVPVHPGEVATDMMHASMGGNQELMKQALPPGESARLQLEVYHRLTLDDSGKFINYKGDSLPW